MEMTMNEMIDRAAFIATRKEAGLKIDPATDGAVDGEIARVFAGLERCSRRAIKHAHYVEQPAGK
jgi:hypothetical protein